MDGRELPPLLASAGAEFFSLEKEKNRAKIKCRRGRILNLTSRVIDVSVV